MRRLLLPLLFACGSSLPADFIMTCKKDGEVIWSGPTSVVEKTVDWTRYADRGLGGIDVTLNGPGCSHINFVADVCTITQPPPAEGSGFLEDIRVMAGEVSMSMIDAAEEGRLHAGMLAFVVSGWLCGFLGLISYVSAVLVRRKKVQDGDDG